MRYIAQRSLRRLPGFQSFDYDFLAPPAQRTLAIERAMQTWNETRPESLDRTGARILINDAGVLDRNRITELLARRDDRPISMIE